MEHTKLERPASPVRPAHLSTNLPRSIDSEVTLPKTETRRGAVATVIVVDRVDTDPHIIGMIAWKGRHYRPGTRIQEHELLESRKNAKQLVLELTEVATSGVASTRRYWRLLTILWQYDPVRKSFSEIARVFPPASYEEAELRRLAVRVMGQDLWRDLESVDEAAVRIHTYLDREIHELGTRRKPVVETVLHRLVSRLVDDGDIVDLAS